MRPGWTGRSLLLLSLLLLSLIGLLACDSVLRTGLDESEANEFVLVLAEQEEVRTS